MFILVSICKYLFQDFNIKSISYFQNLLLTKSCFTLLLRYKDQPSVIKIILITDDLFYLNIKIKDCFVHNKL